MYELEKELSQLINEENRKIGKNLIDILTEVFTIEELNLPSYLINEFKGLRTDYNYLYYSLNVSNYLLDKYKKLYGKQINRRVQHEISLKVKYDLNANEYSTSFVYFGLDGMIKNEKLLTSTTNMLEEMNDNIEQRNVDFQMIGDKLSYIKQSFDNSDSWFVAELLT